MPEAQAYPSWAADSALWLPLFAAEREVELTAVYGSYGSPFNRLGRHAA
jgi:hypothetical protein